MVSSQFQKGTCYDIVNFRRIKFNRSLKNPCKIMLVETSKDLAQIKDEELKKGKKKGFYGFLQSWLTVSAFQSNVCMCLTHTHSLKEEAHSVFCIVWVWIKGKHVVPFCSLEHLVKGREKSHLCWYCHHRGWSCKCLGWGRGSSGSQCRPHNL